MFKFPNTLCEHIACNEFCCQVRTLVENMTSPMNTNEYNPTASTEEDWRAGGAGIGDHVVANGTACENAKDQVCHVSPTIHVTNIHSLTTSRTCW